MSGPAIVLQRTRGVLGLVGPYVDDIARQALDRAQQLTTLSLQAQLPYHVTLLTKAELRDTLADQVEQVLNDGIQSPQVHFAGVGGNINAGVIFAVIVWAAGQRIRKRLGLPPKHFHITLSAHDNHDVDKSIDSLLPNELPDSPAPGFLDHLAFTLHAFRQYRKVQDISTRLVLTANDSQRGYLRLADASFMLNKHKLAMLSYARAYDQSMDANIQAYCMKRLAECARQTEWGTLMLEEELSQIPTDLKPLLFVPWSQELRTALSDAEGTPSLQLLPRQALFIPLKLSDTPPYKLPRFFRWLIPFRFAIMSTPRREEDIAALSSHQLGIRHILTLTEETPLQESWFRGKNITNTYLPIPNFHPPTTEQMDLIVRLFDDESKLPMLVHCGGGKGRAGTVAACYIAAFGFGKPSRHQQRPQLAAAEAVSLLRRLRPGSIETAQQEAFVSKWCSTIWKRRSVFPELPPEPAPCPMIIEGSLEAVPDLVMLVGLPGSGKTWFSKAMISRNPAGWTWISQDNTGSRSACETELGRAKSQVLLDRCNTSAADRKYWLSLASNWCTSPICVWFDYDRDLCVSRAQLRAGHPTLPPGSRVRNAIDQMDKIFVRPGVKEGFKAIVIIRSFAAAEELVLRLSPSVAIYKFPRTPHLINLGAATSDDIMVNTPNAVPDSEVVITEKIDGANMGFSLSSDRSRIIVQNRSHFVNSSSHEQFKKLDIWVERHREELYSILGRDKYFAERYVLFGEWMYATHSIPYSRLPDTFLAFDLYDRAANIWVDRGTLERFVTSTSIALVPVLYRGQMPSENELRNMVQSQSNFWDGRVEGIYVKIERNSSVAFRGKVVRNDFIAGNEHWSRGKLQVNGVAVID